MSGFDHTHEKLETDTSVPYPLHLRTRTCKRCDQPFRVYEMINLGGEEDRWYCKFCYDRPYGEDQHRRGDYP